MSGPSSSPVPPAAGRTPRSSPSTYAIAVTTGIPWLTDGAEHVDAIGALTKAAEALGLSFALPLTMTTSGRVPLIHEEARA